MLFRSPLLCFRVLFGQFDVATPHSDIELQAARRHFFGGIATNCLNNSKSAPLSPSSSPFRTASSSPLIALFNLAFGKREVLPWATKSASRFCHARQLIHRTFRSEVKGEVGITIEGGGGSLQTVAGGILPLHPLIG